MYHRTVHIGLFGISSAPATAIQKVPAPPKFTLDFSCFETLSKEALSPLDIALIDEELFGSFDLKTASGLIHGTHTGFRALVVVADPAKVSTWAPEQLCLADAIWPKPLSVNFAVYEFQKLLRAVKHEADAYITETYLDTLIDSAPEMVWFKALDGQHVKVNKYFCEIVNKTREDVTGKYHNYIWNVPKKDWDKAELTCKVSEDKTIEAGHTCRFDENVSTHGEIRLFDTYKTPIYDEDGSVLGTSGFAHDVTEERRLKHLAWLNANTDYLTGAYNRRYFYDYLEEHEDKGPFIFFMADIDNFKAVNDSLGHKVGDEVLKLFVDILTKTFDTCPIVRWGGDEFIVVLDKAHEALANIDLARAFIDELKRRSKESFGTEITASAGLAKCSVSASVDDAVQFADTLLYRAKAGGKARVCVQ